MKTILFDFGNVIGLFDHGRTLARVAPFTDLSREEMYASVYAGPLEAEFENGTLPVAEFLERVRSLWGLRCDEAFLAAAIGDIFEPNLAICALIPRLAGRFRLVLGSNTNPLHAGRFRRQFADVLQHFDHLVLSHEVGARKPDAAFFEHCLRHAAAPPEDCLFIDDIAANVAGAHAAGMQALLYDASGRVEARLAALATRNP